ncbi:S-adenosylmethionine synthetase [Candidatus Termititenax persephonae]|uniref:S-adenosylmethionine synthase n=1 Tax=Candidatus Termititenax persephonae TaxID=2218525 RepID=A0A388TJX0_9BACT|nr:S-adenosylmethionine synthetase [Candidatus Termititenax persephonae]
MSSRYFFTSESISEGHPDKVADQVSDAILDACLAQDKNSRVACETLVTTNLVVIAGEITTTATVDYEKIARQVIAAIGYNKDEYGFNAATCRVEVHIHQQSPDIAQGVTEGQGEFKEQGAGDQGMMFGYATSETENYLPLTLDLAHALVLKAAELRKSGQIKYLRPDSKSQVTVEYDDGKPGKVTAIVVSHQHDADVSNEQLRQDITAQVIDQVIPPDKRSTDCKILINPTGRFELGGPAGDTGLTGRKIIADSYGGVGSHGGGAFSGKDPSKVDRSAAYMARYIAKNIVAAGLADKCEVQLAYAIGYAQPLSINVDTYGTGKIAEEKIAAVLPQVFDLTPKGIIATLDLQRPIFCKTAAYGHFGRDIFPWEKTDKTEALQQALS